MSGIQGLRGSGQFDEQSRPRNYRELFTLLEPNGNAPLNALLSMGSSESTTDPEYRNFRDELPDRTMTVAAAVADAVTGTITLTASQQNRYAVAGAIVVNATTGEVMRVTADNTGTTLTVTRNIGGTTFQIANGARLFVAGFAAREGGNSPTAITFDATVATNFCQIFRTSFEVSNTLRNTYLRTGDKEDEAMTKALKLHMSDIERAMFFGRRAEDTSTANQPIRYTGGLLTQISTVLDAAVSFGGTSRITEDQFDSALIDTIFAFGSKQKIAFVGATVAAHIQRFGKNRWQPQSVDGVYGVNLTGYQTFAGTLMVHLHPQFRQIPGMNNAMVIVDFPYLNYRYLEGRDTQLLQDRQAPDADSKKHEYLTECGLELLQDKPHVVIRNWNTTV